MGPHFGTGSGQNKIDLITNNLRIKSHHSKHQRIWYHDLGQVGYSKKHVIFTYQPMAEKLNFSIQRDPFSLPVSFLNNTTVSHPNWDNCFEHFDTFITKSNDEKDNASPC